MRVYSQRIVLGAVVIALVLASGVSAAQAQNKCLAGKIKCVAKRTACVLKIYEKAQKKGLPLDDAKLQKCLDKFDGGALPEKGCFAKLEAKDDGPCPTYDDTGTQGAQVDAFVLDVVQTLHPQFPDPGSPNKCAAGKNKCVNKRAKCILLVKSKAAKTGFLDTDKLQKCFDKYHGGALPEKGCFAKLEAKEKPEKPETVCPVTGDSDALEAKVDDLVGGVVCDLDPGATGCAAACPTAFEFTATGSNADYDLGWTGLWHDGSIPSKSRFTLNVSCAATEPPCGVCPTAGPIVNAGGTAFNNRRCRNNTWTQCDSDADCPGVGNGCTYFFGAPRPTSVGGVGVCTTNEIAGSATGTVNVEGGASATDIQWRTGIYMGLTLADPCPRCVGGSCSGGQRNAMPCTVNGTTSLFADDTSFDCPPFTLGEIGSIRSPLVLATGTQTRTLSPASPNCRSPYFPGRCIGGSNDDSPCSATSECPGGACEAFKCMCDTCNNLNAEPCSSNADCPQNPPGTPGICGGKRCLDGSSNDGARCAFDSECPAGRCDVPGDRTHPNLCDDQVCTPNTPPDGDSVNEGVCANGPVGMFCANESYRECGSDAECAPGDTCSVSKFLECFTDNGALGASVSSGGVASPTAPTLSGLFCMGTAVPAVNNAVGLPGLARVTIPGVASLR